MANEKPKAQLFCILARNASSAVIFRRGPSKQVLLIKWSLKKDTFEYGQWLKGRIYERRCDLSPKGEKLIYFAANWKYGKHPQSWTAISKPPYLTALALWPNIGAWGGGGLFSSELTILLNHEKGQRELMRGFTLGRGVKVESLGPNAGRGEDDPIYHTRLIRDGWQVLQEGKCNRPNWDADIVWVYQEPRIYFKKSPKSKSDFSLQMQIKGIHERDKYWYAIDHEVFTENNKLVLSLPRTSWADWDKNGDLLFSDSGKLFRLPHARTPEKFCISRAHEIADFTNLRFEEKRAPKEALNW